MRLIFNYARKYLLRYLLGVLILILTNVCFSAIPWIIRIAIEALRKGKEVHIYVFIIILISISGGLFRVLSRSEIFWIAHSIEYDMRSDLFNHLIRLRESFFRQMRIGDIISRVINDMQSIRVMLGAGFLHGVNTVIVYLFAIALMIRINPVLTVIALLPFPVLALMAKFFTRRLYEMSQNVQKSLSSISSRIQENLNSIILIKSYLLEGREKEEFSRLNDDYFNKSLKITKAMGFMYPLIGLMGGFGTLAVIWIGGRQVINGRMSLGDFVAFNGYLALLLWPTIALGWIVNVVQRGRSAIARIEELFSGERESAAGIEILGFNHSIEFKDFHFSYGSNGGFSIGGVNILIRKGERIAIVGPTGSGKTTIVKSLLRLIDVPRGTVFIDGADINDISPENLRRIIGYVPQEPFLFSLTLKENITLGMDGRGIDKALEISRLSKDLEYFPQKLNTVVGEKGVKLSGGQRQRTALARILLRNPQILILDDPFSSVDISTEREIWSFLSEYLKGRTCIIITHRLTTLRDIDRIYVINRGRIVEEGSSESLIARNGLYAKLYSLSRWEEELNET